MRQAYGCKSQDLLIQQCTKVVDSDLPSSIHLGKITICPSPPFNGFTPVRRKRKNYFRYLAEQTQSALFETFGSMAGGSGIYNFK